MNCNIDSHKLPEFIVTLFTNCGGILFTVLSLVCLAVDAEMDPSVRSILFSFSIANVMGTIMLAYDTIALLCSNERERLHFVMTISVMLSLTHLTLLTLIQHINVTSHKKQNPKDFTGLIVISWIISITIGMMNVVSRQNARLIFAILFLLTLLLLVYRYIIIINKHKKLEKLKSVYQMTFLQKYANKVVKKVWMIKFFALIVFSYAACSILWVLNELRVGLEGGKSNYIIQSASLIVYSMNFYFPSAICIYLKCIQWMSKRNKTRMRVHCSYRYRDVYV